MPSADTEPPTPRKAGTPPTDPATAEDAVMVVMLSLGRRMRHRFPGDQFDSSALPVLKTLLHNGPMRLSALAGQLGLDASTVSRHARQLEDRGMLERTGDPDDGRASRVRLSDHGASCLRQSFDTRRAMIGEILDRWADEDRDRLRLLLSRFYTDLTTPQPDHTAPDQENA
jgi:DNA-binding MarR family transcriptional regulator